jgi:hypothetical protein
MAYNILIKGLATSNRDIQADINTTMEEYQIAVTRIMAENLYGQLLRELRDMVYQYIVPDKVVLYNRLCHPEPHSHGRKYDEHGLTPYTPDFPRPPKDPI